MALKGDTIRLEVQFRTFDNSLIEPTNVHLNIYDEDDVAIRSIPLSEVNRLGLGNFFYDYTLPYNLNFITYEFYGEYYNKPIVSRRKIDVRFVY